MQQTRSWILAFDGSCGACQSVSERVQHVTAGKLEVLPLSSPMVEDLRRAAIGANAPWAPTLLSIGSEGVRAWTGLPLSVRLSRTLGLRTSLEVVRQLGQLKRGENASPESASEGLLSRKRFIQLGAGAFVAGGIVLSGTAPAFADEAKAWVAKNPGKLPQEYAGLKEFTTEYRREIYRQSSAKLRSKFWIEHIRAFRKSSANLNAGQEQVLSSLLKFASDVDNFALTPSGEPVAGRLIEKLSKDSIAAFGLSTAGLLVAGLGESSHETGAQAGITTLAAARAATSCDCSIQSQWCTVPTKCMSTGCSQHGGCGGFWAYTCNANCLR